MVTETKVLFDEFVSDLRSSGFDEVQIEFHLYPVPDLEKLLQEVKKALEKACA
ncbi:hypothetical protein D3C84_1258460 [compost metagenome]